MAHQRLADGQQQKQDETGFGQCNQQFAGRGLAGLAERRIQNEQRYDRQVLKQENADNAAAVLSVEFESLREHLGEDCGRRHGKYTA